MQGLRPEIRDYAIIQGPDRFDKGSNFAQLKEFGLASSDKTPTSDSQQLLAQVIEELSTTRSEDKPVSTLRPE